MWPMPLARLGIGMTSERLLQYFATADKERISMSGLMDVCVEIRSRPCNSPYRWS